MDKAGDVKSISYRAMKRARATLEDFTASYFPYCGLNPKSPQDIFKHLDLLVWLEASIYQLDEDNEAMALEGRREPSKCLLVESPIYDVLTHLGLLDDRIKQELHQGDEYWKMERKLCCEMMGVEGGAAEGGAVNFSLADVMQAHEAKSFDYRVLHAVLQRLEGRQADEGLLCFLRVDELLVDIGDDLTDYEDDVEVNSFNIYRCFVHLYGQEAERKLMERILSLEAEHARLLRQLPQHLQEHYWERHDQASAVPGSGSWVFPSPVLNEAAFRKQLSEGKG